MDEELEIVQANFGTFVNTLSDMDADYHVAAVSGTVAATLGCVNGPDLYIDNSFSATDAIATITTMIDYTSWYHGNSTEQAFTLFEEAISAALNPSGCNAGLIRDDARLALVGISDEEEQSSGYSSNPNYWQSYVTLFQSVKNDPDDVVIHAIGGDPRTGCTSPSSSWSNEPYEGMIEAANATGGMFLSICTEDWGTYLEALLKVLPQI